MAIAGEDSGKHNRIGAASRRPESFQLTIWVEVFSQLGRIANASLLYPKDRGDRQRELEICPLELTVLVHLHRRVC
jgi:hypothetical protein